jgi:nicotinamidase-related amidase
MSSVIDLRTYVGASKSRLLVMIDLQQKNYDELARDRASDIAQSLENCMSAIQHARNLGLPIAFTRQGDHPGLFERSAQSAWISGLEPKRSDMVFERPQPSCYTNQLFEDVVSRVGNFVVAGLIAEETCLATAIDAAHRGHHVTFLNDASVSRCRRDADAQSVHLVATRAMELFADIATTRHWLVATSPRRLKGQRHGRV